MNKILFVSCFPDEMYREMIGNGIIYTQAAQKFNKLLVKGICLNDVDVDVLCVVKETNFAFPKSCNEIYEGRNITYSFCNLEGSRLSRWRQKRQFVKEKIRAWAKENPKGIVILDSLSPIALDIARQAKKHGLELVIHVTDFRDLLYNGKTIKQKICQYILNKQYYQQFRYATMFLLLTKEMTKRIKIGNRPYLVMDGICDYDLKKKSPIQYKHEKTVFLYTGTISAMFGLKNLVEGFIKADLPNAQLHLYGWGDYVEELKETIKDYPDICYFATIPNDEIVKKQEQATYCVNPRPVGDEYTKYSFPSKTIEYLVSARPIITTKLPCITKEYDPHVFWFDDDTVEGIAATLTRCCDIDESLLTEKGSRAREYIIKEKNNKRQMFKLLKKLNYFDKC